MSWLARTKFQNISKKLSLRVLKISSSNRLFLVSSSFQTNYFTVRQYSNLDTKIISSPFRNVNIPDISVTDYVWKRLGEWPQKTAIVCGLTGRSYTYAELREGSRSFAKSLQNAGFKKGQILAIVLPNTPEYPLILFGAIEAGMIVTTVNPIYTPDEMSKQFADSEPSVVVTCPEFQKQVVDGIQLSGLNHPRVILAPGFIPTTKSGETCNFLRMIGESAADWRTGKTETDAPVVLPYSSGTTGLPKGVILTHKNLVSICVQGIDEPMINDVFKPTTDTVQEVMPAVLPFYHIFGLSGILVSKLCLGFKLVTLPKFDPAAYLQVLVGHKASVLFLVPPLVMFLASSPAVTEDHLQNVTAVLSGGAPLAGDDVKRFMKKAPKIVQFVQAYGMTEAPLVTVLTPGSTKFSSVGQCVPNTQAKIVCLETGRVLGEGEVGEICIKGPQVMKGYHNNNEATADMIDSECWLHTGDVGYYDQDKDLHIVDRLKELIKVKGFQVAPAELEALIRGHLDVADVAVIGIPDSRNGEVPVAFVVPKPSATLDTLQEEVIQYVAKNVAEFKQLKGGVRIVTAIPKNPSGKILRKVLREEIQKMVK